MAFCATVFQFRQILLLPPPPEIYSCPRHCCQMYHEIQYIIIINICMQLSNFLQDGELFLPFLQTVLMLFFMFHVCEFVFLSNLTVADCIINENFMLLFIKNEHFTLLNSVCFWGTSSPRPPDQGLCPWTPLGAKPPDPLTASRSRARHILCSPPQ